LAYSEELLGSKQYAVALAGIPTLDQLDVDVSVNGPKPVHVKFERRGMAPSEDLVLDTSAGQVDSVLRNGDLALIRVRPKLDEQRVPMGNTMILVDTSASRAPGFEKQLALVAQLARRVAQEPNTNLTVAVFDQSQELMYRGKGSDFDQSVIDRILRRAAMGATDIQAAVAWAKAEVGLHPVQRLILLTDGVTTMHDLESDPIVPLVRALRDVGLERLDVVLSGGIRDSDAARGWTNQLAKPGVVSDAALPIATIEQRLTRRASGKIAVEVEGATWFFPTELDGLQASDEALVYAELAPKQTVAVRLGANLVALPRSQLGDRALLERAWARAKIASLVERQKRDPSDQSLVRQMVDLSQRFRVISPHTALLVLETNADYDRYDVKRDSNVLHIENGQVVASAADKQAAPAASTASTPENKRYAIGEPGEPSGRGAPIADPVSAQGNLWGDSIADVFGAGGLNLSGMGEGSGGAMGKGQAFDFGSGHGRLAGAHGTSAPKLRTGKTEVSGRLPAEVIQRIVRQNFGRFRMCYEGGLAQNPKLEGRVVTRFVIDRGGQVANAVNGGSTVPNAQLVSCVIGAFYSLQFPAPETGLVTVVYPITFEPGDSVPTLPVKAGSGNARAGFDDQPWDGKFAEVMAEISAERFELATARAQQWREERPSDLLAWVALGRAYRAQGEPDKAARALGSILDLWGFRADLRRFVAGELEAIHPTEYLDMAVDSYRHALADRPDHPGSALWLAVALLKKGDPAEAMKILESAYSRSYAARYRESRRIFGELIQLCAAAQIRKDPPHAALIQKRVEEMGLGVASAPSARFLLTWETDANDVDFHVFDKTGVLAYYSAPVLPDRGGELYADVTDGYGPECFEIDAPRQRGDRRYSLFAHYFRRGPMGAGLGKLEILEHDGKGNLRFESRPYVVTRDGARVPLGDVSYAR
jgi:tetratricopeptide (TPR) repeat protein